MAVVRVAERLLALRAANGEKATRIFPAQKARLDLRKTIEPVPEPSTAVSTEPTIRRVCCTRICVRLV